MGGRTEIDGDQIEEDTITEAKIKDSTILRKDLSLSVFDAAEKTKLTPLSEDITGNQFQQYDILTFNVSEAINKFRLNINFIWGHNSRAKDARFELWLDGSLYEEPLRIEPKDSGTKQRLQNNILAYAENLSIGNHTIELRVRPASASKVTRMYKSVLEVWRVL